MKKIIEKIPTLRFFQFFLNSNGAAALAGKCLLLLVIPYAYLFLCGFVFDAMLKWYFMTGFIFFSLVVLYVLAVGLIVWAIARFAKRAKAGAAK